jgi:hypothetical protein
MWSITKSGNSMRAVNQFGALRAADFLGVAILAVALSLCLSIWHKERAPSPNSKTAVLSAQTGQYQLRATKVNILNLNRKTQTKRVSVTVQLKNLSDATLQIPVYKCS